jgi:succinyl-CoA synthetase beta subunit
LKIHEYQAKTILRSFGVDVPNGRLATTAREAKSIAAELGGTVVVKAQIHAGGRGKGGGVKLAKNPDEAEALADGMLGMNLVTHQTGAGGRLVRKVLIEEGLGIERELYLGIVLDRGKNRLVVMASTEGGVEIEKVAAETPEKIIKEYIDPATGLLAFQMRKLVFGLGLQGEQIKNGMRFFNALYRAFVDSDCSLAEINPLIVTGDGRVLALDAKINFDDNALYRHEDFLELRDLHEEEPLEVEASQYDLNYIKLDGQVGCMVNGAGLAMATMDMIKLAGSEPANFLDVGGTASADTVENGFKILLSDQNVEAVLINIFGGIVRCDRVARGVIEAAANIDISVPVVVRLEGTNAEEAASLLEASGLAFEVARSFQEGAEKIVKALQN